MPALLRSAPAALPHLRFPPYSILRPALPQNRPKTLPRLQSHASRPLETQELRLRYMSPKRGLESGYDLQQIPENRTVSQHRRPQHTHHNLLRVAAQDPKLLFKTRQQNPANLLISYTSPLSKPAQITAHTAR